MSKHLYKYDYQYEIVDFDPYQKLANAIVVQAVKYYREA